jgi:hypothetical protein
LNIRGREVGWHTRSSELERVEGTETEAGKLGFYRRDGIVRNWGLVVGEVGLADEVFMRVRRRAGGLHWIRYRQRGYVGNWGWEMDRLK